MAQIPSFERIRTLNWVANLNFLENLQDLTNCKLAVFEIRFLDITQGFEKEGRYNMGEKTKITIIT